MGSIDSQKYPDLSAREAVKIADLLVNTFGGEPSSRNAFAQEVGHDSADSGAFKMKIADVRRYGLLPSRGLEPTDLAHQVADSQSDREEQEALFKMYQNIPLLNQLYNHLNGQTPSGDFWRILTEITSAEPKDAKEAAPDVEHLYTQMLRVEPDEEDSGNSQSSSEGEIVDKTLSPSSISEASGDGILVQVSDDQLVLSKVSESNLEMARLFIESKKRELSSTTAESDNEKQDTGLGHFTD